MIRYSPRSSISAAFVAFAVGVSAPPAAGEETAPTYGVSSSSATPAASSSEPRPRPDALLVTARSRAATLELAGSSIQVQLRRARQQSDVGRAACLDELLTRVHVATRTGRAHVERITDALRASDRLTAERESIRLEFLVDRAGRLARDAAHCGDRGGLGEGSRFAETTTVRMTAPPLPDAAAYPRRAN